MALSIQPGRFGHSGKPDDSWLAKQEKEPILEPELAIIDTHHHLWDRGGWTYLLPELLVDLNTGHNIVVTVFEECRSMYRAHGPVEMRSVGEVEFVAGIAAHGLTLDAWCYHPQLPDVIALARAVPQATIVMCHAGGVLGYGAYAGKKDEVHAAWRANMAELATCPNVFVKLGGMLNRGAALNFRELSAPPDSTAWAAAWRPYVEPCIGLFGAERCNFESNFPVDKMGTGYATLWNAFKRITAGCSPTEKLALYSGTARRLYHLD